MVANEFGRDLPAAILMEIIQVQTEIARLGLDLFAVMNFAAERVQHLTSAAGAIVEIAEHDEMIYRAATGMAQGQLGLRLKSNGSLSGLCVETGRVLNCEDSETDARVDRDACRRVGLRSMLVAPLRHHDTVVGVLKVASPVVAHFGPQDARILELVSDLIAASMFHAVRHDPDDLYRRATQDPLTGLANRALFYDRLRQAVSLAVRRAGLVGILNLDMNGLKSINDQYGHRAGDAAIRETGQRIARISRRSDTVARLGGDEFGVILPELANGDNLLTHTARLADAIRQPFHFENMPLSLEASIGHAICPDDGTDIDVLIDRADQAMYERKRARHR